MKTAILVTARLKSTRLPMKVLKPIQGRPLIGHLFDRLRLARRPEGIILCTSTVPQDDPLAELAVEEKVTCFRGDPDDVLLRLMDAAVHFGLETVISCTADNPFVDPLYIDRLIDFHRAEKNDYSRIEGLPFGTFSYALAVSAMVKACEIKDAVDTEVWGGYFTQTGLFKWGTLQVIDPLLRRPDLRLTVDEPADFDLVQRIFDALYVPGQVFSLAQIIELMNRWPEIAMINAAVQQKPGKAIRIRKP